MTLRWHQLQLFATPKCTILLSKSMKGNTCQHCLVYRRTLTILAKRQEQANSSDKCDPHSHTNYRYLSTPEKVGRQHNLYQQKRKSIKQVHRLTQKLADLIKQQGLKVENSLSDDWWQTYLRINFRGYFGSSKWKLYHRVTEEPWGGIQWWYNDFST